MPAGFKVVLVLILALGIVVSFACFIARVIIMLFMLLLTPVMLPSALAGRRLR
ncbi:MAG: hypothetical protein PSW75_00010 [bacterium]|nr:hypothetical protein [bacterium]MDI1347503.1 hypothetical protein [Pseudolabrys sp.]